MQPVYVGRRVEDDEVEAGTPEEEEDAGDEEPDASYEEPVEDAGFVEPVEDAGFEPEDGGRPRRPPPNVPRCDSTNDCRVYPGAVCFEGVCVRVGPPRGGGAPRFPDGVR